MENGLFFTLNKEGYCVKNYTEGIPRYIISPENRVDFTSLVTKIASESINNPFYDEGVEVQFDSDGELSVPQKEEGAIRALVNAIEIRAKKNIKFRSTLEKIIEIARR